MQIQVNGIHLFFDVDGPKLVPYGPRMSERPTLVALHGGPGADHTTLRSLVSLTDVAQVVWLDHRSHGRSGRVPATDLSLAVWADDVRAFCEALGIVRPIVFGSSFGGSVALAYAIRHPAHPAGLILNSAKPRVHIANIVEGFRRLAGTEAAEAARGFWQGPSRETFQGYAEHCVPLIMGDDAERAARIMLNVRDALVWLRGEGSRFDLVDAAGAIECPTLILAGTRDPICPIEDARALAERVRANLLTYREFDAGHQLMSVVPGYDDELRGFLGTVWAAEQR